MYYTGTNLKILGNIYKHFTCLAALAWNKDLKDEQSNERAWYDKHIENNIRREHSWHVISCGGNSTEVTLLTTL